MRVQHFNQRMWGWARCTGHKIWFSKSESDIYSLILESADPLEPSQHAQFPAQKHPALYYAEKKRSHTTKEYVTVWFHLPEILEKANLTPRGRKQISGCRGGRSGIDRGDLLWADEMVSAWIVITWLYARTRAACFMWTILLYVNSISGKLILRTAASFAGIVSTLIQDRETKGPERIQLWENIMAQGN